MLGGKILILEFVDLNDMSKMTYETGGKLIQLHGNGLFSKEEVTVSISKLQKGSGIIFLLNNEQIPALVDNVTNTTRNTALTNGKETICLAEHFLAACSVLGIDDIEVETNKNELIFNDGSAMHWYGIFKEINLFNSVVQKYKLKEPIFIKKDDKVVVAIPHNGFKASYLMDYNHPALGKLWASWTQKDGPEKLLRARTFGTREENDFFCATDRLLTLEENSFNKKLHEPLEPVYHKILDIIGDLRLCGINPLEINMHVIGFKSGHALNVELVKKLQFLSNPV